MSNVIRLVNSFHNTEVTVRPRADMSLSYQQVARARRVLCGRHPYCFCATDAAGQRGDRSWDVVPDLSVRLATEARYFLLSRESA